MELSQRAPKPFQKQIATDTNMAKHNQQILFTEEKTNDKANTKRNTFTTLQTAKCRIHMLARKLPENDWSFLILQKHAGEHSWCPNALHKFSANTTRTSKTDCEKDSVSKTLGHRLVILWLILASQFPKTVRNIDHVCLLASCKRSAINRPRLPQKTNNQYEECLNCSPPCLKRLLLKAWTAGETTPFEKGADGNLAYRCGRPCAGLLPGLWRPISLWMLHAMPFTEFHCWTNKSVQRCRQKPNIHISTLAKQINDKTDVYLLNYFHKNT